MIIGIIEGEEWVNKINGNRYTVIHIANEFSEKEEYPIHVVYQGSNERVWCKELSNFLITMCKTE